MAPWEDFSPIFCPYLDIWGLASPTMHGEELKYVTEAYETNWMSTVGKNINEVEKIAAAVHSLLQDCSYFPTNHRDSRGFDESSRAVIMPKQ